MSERSGQRHPDVTELAEYHAGLAAGLRGRRLAAHVASCARCASVGDELAAVSSALAAAPAPRLPDAVEHRITAALAAEATSATNTSEAASATPTPRGARAASLTDGPRHASPGGSPGGSRHDAAGPGRGRRRSRRGARRFRPAVVLSGAGAAVLILIGVLVGLAHLPGSSSSSSAAGSAASSPLSGAAAAPAQRLVPGTVQGPSASQLRPVFHVTASGTRYAAATLAAQVRGELAASAPKSAAAAPTALAPSATLAGCVLHLTGNVPPRLVDYATYDGEPAYVIAVSNRVWVVGPGCTASNPDLIASTGM